MAFWTNLLNSIFETGKPIRAVDGRALRDNPIAMFEGAPGAPKLQGKALDIAIGTIAPAVAIGDLEDAAKILLVGFAVATNNDATVSATVSYQRSPDNGATWGGAITIATQVQSKGTAGGPTHTANACGAALIDMTGFNAIRMSSGTGVLIYVEGN